jgi:hypothetical protein
LFYFIFFFSLKIFQIGKELFICQTAFEEFTSIVNTVGGPNEKKRAEELFKRVYQFISLIFLLLIFIFS